LRIESGGQWQGGALRRNAKARIGFAVTGGTQPAKVGDRRAGVGADPAAVVGRVTNGRRAWNLFGHGHSNN
jgi:hypothetical protein